MAESDSTLSVMLPAEINDSVLFSSTVSEADHPVYAGGTTYALGDRVIHLTTHRIYESAANSNTGHDPTDITNRVGATIWWIDVSATNRWKMFDGEQSSGTVDGSPLTVVLRPSWFFSSIAVLGIDGATEMTVTMDDSPGGTEVYNNVIDLEGSEPPDYYEYFFAPFQERKSVILDDIPPYASGEVTITLTAASGNISVGMLQLGQLRDLGTTQYNAQALPKSFSYISIDAFGNNTIKRRKASKDVNLTAIVPLNNANLVMELLTTNLDKAVVWVASPLPDYAGLIVFGLGNGRLSYDSFEQCILNLTVKGLI